METAQQLASLTERDIEVLQGKSCGLTDEALGKVLVLSTDTIGGRLRIAHRRLGYYESEEISEAIGDKLTRSVCFLLRLGIIEGPPKADEAPVFTTENMEVIRLLPEGLTNTQIGARLFLTEAAIKSRVASALSQSGTKTRTHLAALAIVHRII